MGIIAHAARSQSSSQSRPKSVNGRYVLRAPSQLELQDCPIERVIRGVLIQNSDSNLGLGTHNIYRSCKRF